MRRHMLRWVKRFGSDERGAFAMIFTVLAIVLVATSGAVVDYTSMQQARTRAQVALDAAALALQPKIYDTSTDVLEGLAQNLVIDRLDDNRSSWGNCSDTSAAAPCASVDSVVPDTTEGTLTLQAQLKVPMFFVSLVGVPELDVRIESQATRKKLNLEVALVLDNTGSMSTTMDNGSSRMATLQKAACIATQILFYGLDNSGDTCDTSLTGLTQDDNVKMGVVPFTSEVNVGTVNADATWMDRTGTTAGSITDDNFDSDDDSTTPFSGPVDRIALFSQMGKSWGGCVEARKTPYDTTDDAPVSGTDTMFTPFIWPDEPDSGGYYNSYLSDTGGSCVNKCVMVQVKLNCSSTSYGSCSSSVSSTTYTNYASDGSVLNHPSNCASKWASPSVSDTYQRSGSRYTDTRTTTNTYNPPARERQERLCKYNGGSVKSTSYGGPNGDCPATAIEPLSTDPSSVIATIKHMSPGGNTNIQSGTAWGWRVLSPGEPFTQGLPYDQATSKAMIVMTDGDDTAGSPYNGYGWSYTTNMNGSNYYQAWGYPYNSANPDNRRLAPYGTSQSDLEKEMDNRLKTTCDNAKAAGITIYTIGLAPSSNGRTLLTYCATDSSKAYFPSKADDLIGDFKDIANQLAALRLSK